MGPLQDHMPGPTPRRGRWTRSALGALLFFAGLCVAVAYLLTDYEARLRIDAESERMIMAERLLSAMKDIETGERGFVITGAENYLEPYRAGLAALKSIVGELAAVSPTLPGLVDAKLAVVAEIVERRRSEGNAAARASVVAGFDKSTMDDIRAAIASLEEAAERRIMRERAMARGRGTALLTGALAATVLGFAIILLEVRRRRRSEQASRLMLTGVLENAPVGLGFLDRALRLGHMNQALATMRATDLGASLWDMLPTMQATLASRLREVIDAGRTLRDIEIALPDQRQPDGVCHLLFGFFPIASAHGSGRADGVGMVVSDVTARKRNEKRVRESEERFRTLIQASSAIIWTTDAAGEFEQPQPGWTAFTGQDFADARGSGWIESVHPDDRAETLHRLAEALESRGIYEVEHRLRRRDGAWRTMAVRGVPILNEDATVREWVGSHSDITERRLAEAELVAARDAAESANRAKSQFLANMSHELRTPLSAVIGYSEMLQEEVEELGQPALLDDLGKINSNARHLLSLINDVLDLSKIEAERMTVFAETFPVATLANEVSSTVQALIAKKNNTLVVDLVDADTLGAMHTDVVKLRQCLFNLISNAAKFTENGRITLSVAREADWIVFSVADTGIGMSAEQLGRLFERFAQADTSTTRRFGGTGLGLAITRAFGRLLGGDVAVTSTEGEGSVFTLRLPATFVEPSPDAGAAEAPPSDKAAGHLVLVIDDDPSQRDLLTRFLEREGFAVRVAADGERGLAMARSLKPRAILLDVMMPQLDGWSVLAALKADPAVADIPVVLVTFMNEPALGASLGAADLIPKPVDWERMKQVMERFRGEGGVLVVDDDDDARSRLRQTLERSGWTVAEAANGSEALQQVTQQLPQLILLDLTMPVMDGFAFLHALRVLPAGRDVPVVVLTARDLSAAERRQLDGAERVLSKGQISMGALAGEVMALAGPPPARDVPAAGEA